MSLKKQKIKLIILTVFLLVGFFVGKIDTTLAISPEDPGSCVYKNKMPDMPSEASGFNNTTIYAVPPKVSCQRKDCENGMFKGDTATTNCTFFDKGREADAEKFEKALRGTVSSENDKEIQNQVGEPTCAWLTNPAVCALSAILKFIGYLLSAAATLIIWIMDPENITMTVGNPITYTLWAKVRDILNIAFILVLLFSAFATVFQVSKFNYQNILKTLILMALLVNFSFPIARVIIDFSNVIMYYFLNSFGFEGTDGGTFGQLVKGSGLSNIVNNNSNSTVSYLITAVVFTFIFTVTLIILGIMFVIRLAALTFLVIFSPIAFVGSIVPFLSGKASAWWDNLFKYAFFGPIMVFMMYVSIMIIENAAAFGQGMKSISTGQSVDAGLVSQLAFFSVPIIVLWMGMATAQSMSIAGASTVVGQGQKFLKWSGKNLTGYNAGKFLAKAGAGKIERGLAKTKYGKFLVPRVYKEAYKQRAAIKDREAFDQSTGEMHDFLNKVLSRGKEKTDYGFAAHESKVAKYKKEISDTNTNSNYVIEELEKSIANKNHAKAEACMKILASQNDLNDMMHAIGKSYGKGVSHAGPTYVKAALVDMLKQSGVADERMIGKQLLEVGNIATNSGNLGLAGMGGYDRQKGEFIINSDEDQAAIAAAKFGNLEPQQRQRTLHHNSLYTEDERGQVVDIDVVQEAVLKQINRTDIDQINRSRDDLRRQTYRANEGVLDIKIHTEKDLKEMTTEKRIQAEKENATIEEYREKTQPLVEKVKAKLDRLKDTNPALIDYAIDNKILYENTGEKLTKDREKKEKKPENSPTNPSEGTSRRAAKRERIKNARTTNSETTE